MPARLWALWASAARLERAVARNQASHFTVDNLPRLRHLGSDQWAEIDQFAIAGAARQSTPYAPVEENVKQLLVGRLP